LRAKIQDSDSQFSFGAFYTMKIYKTRNEGHAFVERYIEDLAVDISLVEVVPKCLFKACL